VLANIVDTITDMQEADNIWRLKLTKPKVVVNAPFAFNAGVPNSVLVSVLNAKIDEVRVYDSSGTLFAGAADFFTFTPIEGSYVTIEIKYTPEYTELWGGQQTITKTIPVMFSTSYTLSLTEDTSVESTEYEYGWTVLHLIVVSGVGVLAILVIIKLAGRRRR